MNSGKYGVPIRTTEENLETRWHYTVKYGNYVIIAGHYWWGGTDGPNYYASIFQYLDDNKTDVDDDMELLWTTEIEFEDPGHAFKWAFEYIDRYQD